MTASISKSNLGDHVTCGEDIARNVTQTISFAPQYCDFCADYHIVNTLKRLSGLMSWDSGVKSKGIPSRINRFIGIVSNRTGSGADVVSSLKRINKNIGVNRNRAIKKNWRMSVFVTDVNPPKKT